MHSKNAVTSSSATTAFFRSELHRAAAALALTHRVFPQRILSVHCKAPAVCALLFTDSLMPLRPQNQLNQLHTQRGLTLYQWRGRLQ